MKRIINHPDQVVDDAVRGYLKVYAEQVLPTDSPRVVKSADAGKKGRVGVITGGGSGHEPAFLGYVGRNMLDAVAIGEVFASPSAKYFLEAMRAANGGVGVACLYGNYAGDNMNVKLAAKMAEKEGITVRTVVANDDVPSAPKDELDRRRGVAGEIVMWKVGCARAAEGGSLDEVIAAAQHALENTRSAGIGLTACTIPANGKPNFEIAEGEMEVGIGHHGEPGIAKAPIESAKQMADRLVDIILPDLPFSSGDRVFVLISGLGATPLMELYILYDRVEERLKAAGMVVVPPVVGNMFTSLEMMGATLTLVKLDAETERLLRMPASCAAWTVTA